MYSWFASAISLLLEVVVVLHYLVADCLKQLSSHSKSSAKLLVGVHRIASKVQLVETIPSILEISLLVCALSGRRPTLASKASLLPHQSPVRSGDHDSNNVIVITTI